MISSRHSLVPSVALRLLLRILRRQQSSFVLQRSRSVLHTTDEALQRLGPTETTLQALTEVATRSLPACCVSCEGASFTVSLSWIFQVMSQDLNPEKMREDYQDGESLASVCVQSFTERWWNKALVTAALQT